MFDLCSYLWHDLTFASESINAAEPAPAIAAETSAPLGWLFFGIYVLEFAEELLLQSLPPNQNQLPQKHPASSNRLVFFGVFLMELLINFASGPSLYKGVAPATAAPAPATKAQAIKAGLLFDLFFSGFF